LRADEPAQSQSGEDRTVWPLRGLSAELEMWLQPSRGPVHVTIGTEAKPALHFHFDATHGTVSFNAHTVEAALPRGKMRVSLYLDGSVVELLVNDRLAHTSRVYDLDPERTTLTIVDAGAAVTDALLWQMKPISSNRLTT
jgi:hypothetical protein